MEGKRIAVIWLRLLLLTLVLLVGGAGRAHAKNYAKKKYNYNRWKVIGKDYLKKKTDRLIFVRYKSGTKARVEMWKKVTVPAETGAKTAPVTEAAQEEMTLPQTEESQAAVETAKPVTKWKRILSCGGYVGKNGIKKVREGDKKTPVGTFHVTMAFGRKKSPGTAGISYTKLNKYHYWSGEKDTYNTFVDVRTLGRKYVAGEHLINYNPFYNYSLAFDFNKKGVYKKGSAIFLHCSKKGHPYTAGCIAVAQKYMKKIVKNTTTNTMIFIYPDYPEK